jgi:GxxExxY protein
MYDGLHVDITDTIIGCAIEVHRHLGPGLLESVYETALCMELAEKKLRIKRQVGVPLYYKGQLISEHRPDVVVADAVIVEIKNVLRLEPIHVAQMLTYLKVTGLRVGLLLNFNSTVMKQGVRRVAL